MPHTMYTHAYTYTPHTIHTHTYTHTLYTHPYMSHTYHTHTHIDGVEGRVVAEMTMEAGKECGCRGPSEGGDWYGGGDSMKYGYGK